jgi:hypothetical protein
VVVIMLRFGHAADAGWRHVVQLPFMLPLAMMFPVMHDGYIGALGAYSPSALRTLTPVRRLGNPRLDA